MSSEIKTQNNLKIKEQMLIKPYIFDFSYPKKLLIDKYFELEYKDLKDFKNAAIKELRINNCNYLTNNARLYLTELLSNENIKKLTLYTSNCKCNTWLRFITKLLQNNKTIKEIEIDFYKVDNTYNSIEAWKLFLTTASNRIVKVSYSAFSSKDDTDLNKLLFSNSNLKEIKLNSGIYCEDYYNIVKYILSSNKYLDEFSIRTGILDINQNFFDNIYKSGFKAEINTLVLEKIPSVESLVIIDNAYILNTETIKIKDLSYTYSKETIDHIFKLSNNPLNTVKRIIIDKLIGEFEDIISQLNPKNYNTQRIPQIYIDSHKEVKIYSNEKDNTYKIDCLYKNSECLIETNGVYIAKLTIKDNILDENSFTALLSILFNCPERIKDIRFSDEYDTKDDFLLGFIKSRYNQENIENIVNQMRTIFSKFKENNIHSKDMKINELIFSRDRPEFNIFHFTILDILIQMKIKIEKLTFNFCTIEKLVEYLDKYKTIESLNIKVICIIIREIDLENIVRLNQYSHLIGSKFIMKLYYETVFIAKVPHNKEYKDFYSEVIRNSNFIEICNNNNMTYQHSSKQFSVNNDIINFVKRIRNLDKIMCEKSKFLMKNITYSTFDCRNFDLEVMIDLFSLLKEHNYYLNKTTFYYMRKLKPDYARKIVSMYLETILDNKYRKNDVYWYQSQIECSQYKCSRKSRRIFELHNINIERIF